MTTIILHNPRCSKSRQALELLKENNIEPQIIEYLKTGIDKALITKILKLGSDNNLQIRDLLRTKEDDYKNNNLCNSELSSDQLINFLVNYPKILERPIVIHNNKSAVCRPPELVLELIK